MLLEKTMATKPKSRGGNTWAKANNLKHQSAHFTPEELDRLRVASALSGCATVKQFIQQSAIERAAEIIKAKVK